VKRYDGWESWLADSAAVRSTITPKGDHVSKTQELTQESSRQDLLARLSNEQDAIKARLRELEQPPALSSAERVERAQLQQRRYETQDRILRLQNH
jgi:hypothetical protein